MLARPYATQEIPHECAVVRFVGIVADPLHEVSYGRINVAVRGYSLLPIVLAVLFTALLEVLGYFEEHMRITPELGHDNRKSIVQMGNVTVLRKLTDEAKYTTVFAVELGYHIEG